MSHASSAGRVSKEMVNETLSKARKVKNDEFYTQWADIEREINSYLEYDPDAFRGKTILLPCDDPDWSNFTKFFALHFREYGLKKLISTSYAPSSKDGPFSYLSTRLERDSPGYDEKKSWACGRVFVLNETDINSDGSVNINDLRWSYLSGDGDFRSEEVTALRDECDIIITNPPFSLFREFVTWVIEGQKKFSVVGNSNASTYIEVFHEIKHNRMWKGATANNTDMVFAVPKGSEVKESDKQKAERLGYPSDDDFDYTRMGMTCWFTNIEHGRRHEPLQLMTMAENLKYSRHQEVRDLGYREYDNYPGIEVPFMDAVPSDYDGVMGVPITFLDKYCPEQFRIVGSFNAGAHAEEIGAVKTETHTKGKVILWNGPVVNKEPLYKRILIQRLREEAVQ